MNLIKPSILRFPGVGLLIAALLVIQTSTVCADEISASDAGAVSDTPPTLVWSNAARSADGTAGVELSLDGFQTVFYSTDDATGLSIDSGSWELPEQLWSYLPEGTSVSWRAVEPNGNNSARTLSQGSFTVGATGARSTGGAVQLDFRQATKLQQIQDEDLHLPEEILVQVRANEVADAIKKLKDIAFPIERITTALGRTILRFQLTRGADVAKATTQARARYSSLGLFRSDGTLDRKPVIGDILIQPNNIHRAQITPTDPFFTGTGSPVFQYAPNLVHAHEAWAADITGKGVVVAVIDSGLDVGIGANPIHQEFNGPGKVIIGPDYVNQDQDPADDQGHGSNVSGIAVAEADGVGMVGIAPDATLMPIKVLDNNNNGTTANISQGVDYAVANCADVANLSLGYNVFGNLPNTISFSLFEELAIQNAIDLGMVVVAAAGNDNVSLPAFPAGVSDTIYVGAIDSASRLTDFSNYGPWLTVVAPGLSMYSADPAGAAAYSYQSGTSQATPVVTGACALILQRFPTLTPRQVKVLLENTADDIGPNGRDNFFGYGRVNIARALGLAQVNTPIPPTLSRVEITTDTLVAFFTQNMLADGTANAVNNPANWTATATLNGWLTTAAGRTITWSAANQTLTVKNTSTALAAGSVESFGVTSNVVSAGSPRKVFCNDNVSNVARGSNFIGRTDLIDFNPNTMMFTVGNRQSFINAVAESNGRMQVLFRDPVTKASAENRNNYMLTSQPGASGPQGGPPPGAAVSLATANFSYDVPTQVLTISNLPAVMQVQGNTFGLLYNNQAVISTTLANPLNNLNSTPNLGVILDPTTATLRLTAVTNTVIGFNMRETVRLTFSKPIRTNAAVYDRSNYTVSVNGANVPLPADMDIIVGNPSNEIILTGFNFQAGNNGQALNVTVNNIQDVYLNTIAAPNNTQAGNLTITANIPPQIQNAVANSTSVAVQFGYWTKMNIAAVTTPGNWTLTDGGLNVPLAMATFDYNTTDNTLLISGITLTPGFLFTITGGAGVVKRHAPALQLANAGTFTDVVGGDDDDLNDFEDDFVKMVFEMPAPIDPAVAKVRVMYNEADPKLARITAVGPPAVINAGSSGTLRIWNKNGDAARNCNSIKVGGNFVASDTYDASELGLTAMNRTIDLWVEGIAASASNGDDRIVFEVDPNNSGNFFCSDAVRVTVQP